VIVVEPRAAAAHEPAGDRPDLRFEYQAAVELVLLPAAEILEEEARIVARAGDLGAAARV
jgi:hypothetical protein